MMTRGRLEVILFNNKRWTASELAEHGFVDIAAPADELMGKALELAVSLKAKGQGPARMALGGIKQNVYKRVLDAMREGGGSTAGRSEGHRGGNHDEVCLNCLRCMWLPTSASAIAARIQI